MLGEINPRAAQPLALRIVAAPHLAPQQAPHALGRVLHGLLEPALEGLIAAFAFLAATSGVIARLVAGKIENIESVWLMAALLAVAAWSGRGEGLPSWTGRDHPQRSDRSVSSSWLQRGLPVAVLMCVITLVEWPLGLTTEEAEHLAASARTAGVHDAIGLQARYAPDARLAWSRVRKLARTRSR